MNRLALSTFPRLPRALSTLRFLAARSDDCAYVGWLGYDNLGDELLFDVARECVSPLQFQWMPQPHRAWLRSLADRKHHACVMLGGGTQIGEPSPIDWFVNRLKRSRHGVVFGTGVQPQTDGPIPEWLHRWGDVLRPLPYVGVRGPTSAATLSRVGVNAEVLGDPVCWFSRPIEQWRPQDRTLGINVGQSNGHMYGSEEEIQRTMINFARTMVDQGWRIEFFCVWPEDMEVTLRVARSAGLRDIVVHEFYTDANGYLDTVARMRIFVGIKLHAVALAMCANVPSLMIAYRDKCREFMATLGMEACVIRSDELDLEEMLRLCLTLEKNGTIIAAQIQRGMLPIRQGLERAGRRILQVATSAR